MRINKIDIENFKGFEKASFSFNKEFTIFVGDNGSGKSALLDALSIAIGTILMKTGAAFSNNGKRSRPLLKNEIRKVSISDDNIELSNVVLSGEFEYNNETLTWSRSQPTTSGNLSIKNAKSLTLLGQSFADKLKDDVDLPLVAYHSTSRLAGQIHGKRAYEKIGSRLDGYYACLDPRSISDKFISWFKTYEDSVLKFQKDKTLYNAFCEAVISVVPEWEEIKFHWGLDDIIGRQLNNMWFPLSDLSDGYRAIIGLVADLAYRAIKLNPHLGANAVKETRGIVLIDEIDMHLHPKWQKSIIDDLKKAFPNVQFIATTHSPLVIGSLNHGEIFNINEQKAYNFPIQYGRDANAILKEMDTEPMKDDLSKQIDEYFLLIENGNGKSVMALELREELESKLGKEHAELQRADIMLSFF